MLFMFVTLDGLMHFMHFFYQAECGCYGCSLKSHLGYGETKMQSEMSVMSVFHNTVF